MRKELNIQSVADDIRAVISHNPDLVKKIGIFGSLARGDFNEDSDIDLLVRYNSPPIFSLDLFDRYCGLCNKLQDTLTNAYQRNVDIVHFDNDSLSNLYDPDVKKEVVWV